VFGAVISARRVESRVLPAALLGALAVVLVFTRLSGLGVSFWRDEILSIVHYSSGGPHSIWLGHYEPNDHVLFNFLSWATTSAVGHSEVDYRLWSVGPSIGAVVLVSGWLWQTWSRWLAVAFAGLAVTSPVALELGNQARGYGLGFLAGALLLISAASIARGGGRRWFAGLAAAGLLGTWTLTGFLIAYAGQAGSLIPDRRARRGVVVASVVVLAGTLVFYAPLLGAILGSTGDFKPAGQPLRWDALVFGPGDQLLAPTSRLLLHVHSAAGYQLIFLGLAVGGGVGLWRAGERFVLLALAGPLVFTELALTILAVSVNPRFVSFLLFHCLLLLALGVLALGRVAARAVRARSPVIVVASALLAVMVVRVVQLNDYWNRVPLENFKRVAQVVHRAGFSDATTDSLKPLDLRFYLGKGHVRVLPPEQLEALFCGTRQPLAYVDHLASPEIKYAGDPVRPMRVSVSCLRARDATLVTVPERKRGVPVNVWLLCAPALALASAGCGGGHPATAVRLVLTSAPRAVASACGKQKSFLQYPARQQIGAAGTVTPTPSGTWRAKVKVKRCLGTAYNRFIKLRATTGVNGSFGASIGPLPPGYYQVRAEVRTTAGLTDSARIYFHVAR
jgi:hypothetical protein